ncbi:protein mono-ADP-ribosyltransferase TIPARP-like [Pelodytes ibericus]
MVLNQNPSAMYHRRRLWSKNKSTVSARLQKSSAIAKKVMGLEPAAEETALADLEFTGLPNTNPRIEKDGLQTDPVLDKPLAVWVGPENPVYHIHQEDNIDICSWFLAGNCPQGALCPRHHTMLPYHWQLRAKDTRIWHSVGGYGQELLERLYSDPKRECVRGTIGKWQKILINFTTMEVATSPTFDHIRRLSTSANLSVAFSNSLQYYYEAEYKTWFVCGPEFVQSVEKGLKENSQRVYCSTPLYRYRVDLCKLYQKNLETGNKTRIRFRPMFRSPTLMMSELWTISSFRGPNFCQKDSHPGQLYPATWLITDTSMVYEKVLLRCEDPEFPRVYSHFHKTMGESQYLILEISRIQNYFQWEKYISKRRYMHQRLTGIERSHMERHLFHGTGHSSAEAICRHNFDPRLSSKKSASYGRGCYFAKDANYSNRFATSDCSGHHFMFLAKVLVGCPTVGHSTYRRPPAIDPDDPKSLLYDSCVSQQNNPDIFIVFDNDQFYPNFLIKYQKLQNIVPLD